MNNKPLWDREAFERELAETNAAWKQNADNPIAGFLRWHLLIERHLRQAIALKMKRSKRFYDIKGLKLAGLADLACAMGLFSEEVADTLVYIDSVRNNLAHNLDFKLDENINLALDNVALPKEKQVTEDDFGRLNLSWQWSLYIRLRIMHKVVETLLPAKAKEDTLEAR